MNAPGGTPEGSAPTDDAATRQGTLKPWQRDRFRQVVIWVVAGSAGVAAVLVTVLLVMGGNGDPGSASNSVTPTSSATASEVVETPSPQASSIATATPSLAATSTPVPSTPPTAAPQADPPAALGFGWHRVLTELNLREEPASVAALVARLPRDEVVWVVGQPHHRGGYDWYQAATLDEKTGWIASGPTSDPFAARLAAEEILLSCGRVDSSDGIRVDGLRIGPLDAVERGGFELAAATGDEQCVTYALDGNRPVAYLRLLLDACGGPTWDGAKLTFKPTLWGDVVPDYKVKRTVEVARAFLNENSLLDSAGMSNKLKVLLLGGQLEEPFGCISLYIEDAGDQIRRELEVWLSDCLIMTDQTARSVTLKPATGGAGVTLLKPGVVNIDDINVDQPTRINLFAWTHPEEKLTILGFGGCSS